MTQIMISLDFMVVWYEFVDIFSDMSRMHLFDVLLGNVLDYPRCRLKESKIVHVDQTTTYKQMPYFQLTGQLWTWNHDQYLHFRSMRFVQDTIHPGKP